ncbi:MAG TPA: thiamine pyrophosphate-binding protein [Rhodocyclaceae bacterium]|nr:thiamine pyrophosphate-binding protein [Rhodocyclaceae bacterium]
MDRAYHHALDKPVVVHDITDVADLIVAYLDQLAVDFVFGVPGGAIEPLYNALARSERRGGVRVITARHEAGAAFMADGYARDTGKLGVCIATSGPGATNMITGVACAYDNDIPLLAITGQPPLPSHGRRALQESGSTGVNIAGMFRHCTRYNTSVVHVSQAETKIVAAIMRASQASGTAHLSIPVDIQRSNLASTSASYDLPRLLERSSLIDIFSVQALVQALSQSRNAVFLIGSGCSESISTILALASRLGARFVTTPDAKGLVSSRHPLNRGVFGFAGHESARELLLDNPDLVVAIGTSLGEWTSGGWSDLLLCERLIHIDSSDDHLMRSPMARLHVRGHIRSVIDSALQLLDDSGYQAKPLLLNVASNEEPIDSIAPVHSASNKNSSARMSPVDLMHSLSRYCPPTTRIVADAGNSSAWAIHHLEIADRRAVRPSLPGVHCSPAQDLRNAPSNWLHVLMDFAPMGWAIGAAIGMAAADRSRAVVCLTGDGSYLMNGQEITVAQAENLPVVFIVLNDGALGMVKHGQRLANAESIGFELPAVDYAAMANAMGINAKVITSADDFDRLNFGEILNHRGPTLLDVRIDSEVMPPISMRLKTLGTAP